MQTTSSAMIDDLLQVIGKSQSKFVGFYDTLKDLTDAISAPADDLQAIVINPSEFYYHASGGVWAKFAPVGEVHPSYVGAYATIQDLQAALSAPNDGDIAIIGKQKFYIYDSGNWDALITSASGTDTAQTTKNTADIAQIKSAMTATAKELKKLEFHDIFQYRGKLLPTLPAWPARGYFINVYALSNNEIFALPEVVGAEKTRKGTIFYLNNEDSNNSIRLTVATGKINGSSSVNIPSGNVVILSKTDDGWQMLLDGFFPPSKASFISDIKRDLAGELHTTEEETALINNWLANPTTQANLDKIIKNLGYEKTGSSGGLDPASVRIHIGTGDDYPSDFSQETAEYAPHETMTIEDLDLDPKKVWIAVPTSIQTKVTGISANEGLAARWSSTRITVNGEFWTVFLSPTRLADTQINFNLRWRV